MDIEVSEETIRKAGWVIGGLIVLGLLLVFVLPIFTNAVSSIAKGGTTPQTADLGASTSNPPEVRIRALQYLICGNIEALVAMSQDPNSASPAVLKAKVLINDYNSVADELKAEHFDKSMCSMMQVYSG